MTVHPDDLFDLIRKMRMDLTQLQARVTDLANMLAALKLEVPASHRCDRCGADFPNELTLLDHRVAVHDEGHEEREEAWMTLEERAA